MQYLQYPSWQLAHKSVLVVGTMDLFAIINIAVIKLQFSPICRPLASAAWCGPHPRILPRYASAV